LYHKGSAMIIFKEERHMDVGEFKEFSPILLDFVQDRFKIPKDKMRIEFCASPCLGESNNDIVVYIDSDFLNFNNFDLSKVDFYSDYMEDKNKWEEKFGVFDIGFARDKNEKVTDVNLGDLVLIENEYSWTTSDVGIVTSINECGDKKYFGCSYFAIHGYHRDPMMKISAEDYGDYKKGFAKKLTVEEAEKIIKEKLELSYQSALNHLKNEKESCEIQVSKVLRNLGDKNKVSIENCTRLVFNDYDGTVDKSLIKKLVR